MMTRWIQYKAHYDNMPLDLSFVYKDEKPAGKHGFLKVDGEIFRFEDGTPSRFWGVCFNGALNFPSHDYSEKVAERLAKTGVNIVRLHQLDGHWYSPNIFSFTKGTRLKDTRSLDPRSMERLDYLVFCLKKEGIYCYLDNLVYRWFLSGDGMVDPEHQRPGGRPYSMFDPTLIERQKEYIRDLWNHVNPYTGLAYKDDPVFVLSEIANENDLFSPFFYSDENYNEYYINELREMFKEWLVDKGIDTDLTNFCVGENTGALLDFKIEVCRNYFKEMYDYMRSVGIKIPIVGTNWMPRTAVVKANENISDFSDSHFYFNDNRAWAEGNKLSIQKGVMDTPECYNMGSLAKRRMLGDPFIVSEWAIPWPNPFRASGPVTFASICSFQNWSGMILHTYGYDSKHADMDIIGKEASSETLGNVGYREGLFASWNDPAVYGLFYHCALIVRRQDIAPSMKKIAVLAKNLGTKDLKATNITLELSQVSTCFEEPEDKSITVVPEDKRVVEISDGEIRSDNGQLYRNWEKGYGIINSERTQCIYGNLWKAGKLELDNLSVEAATDFATVALSSLTDEGIGSSDNMLLSMVGRANNSGTVIEGLKLVDFGKPPIMIEVIQASISIRTSVSNLRVWAVNSEGHYIGALKTQYTNGILSFRTGEICPSMYYLILAE